MSSSSESMRLARLTGESSRGKASYDSSNQTSKYYGILIVCWCGEAVVMLTSRRETNPFRRFYRCKYAADLQLVNDKHVFKWFEAGVEDELKKLEVQIEQLEKVIVKFDQLENEIKEAKHGLEMSLKREEKVLTFENHLENVVHIAMKAAEEELKWRMKKNMMLSFLFSGVMMAIVMKAF